ncbi:septum formation protein Maf [Candidatus Micrarchaeota archaeon]|nr:septum formation protein Maf [Candidatus Micrarchaeota archaeon]
MIILATGSPHRIQFFKELGLDFIAETSSVDEKTNDRPDDPVELVKYLAKLKAEAVAKNYSSGIVIGFDSVGEFDGEILEKVSSRQEAFDRLKKLSGNKHNFFTGIHIIDLDTGKTLTDVAETFAHMRELTDDEIKKFLDQDKNESYKTYALAYDPFGKYSSSFIEKIEGSMFNILQGLPVEKIVVMLKEIEK